MNVEKFVQNKLVTKDHKWSNSVYMKCPSEANLYREKVD